MAIPDDAMLRRRDEIVAEMLTALTAAISDAYVGEDGVARIIFEIEAGQLENLYLANQLLLEDSFVTTASFQALRRYGEQYGIIMQDGTQSTGTLTFFGGGGTYIPIGTEVAYDPGEGLDVIYFETTSDGTIPNTGIPSAPVAAVNAVAGNLNGLYEYVVTFVTAAGETLPGAESNAASPTNQQVALSGIPVGGPGVIARRIYRDKDGAGVFRRIAEIANNTATTYNDNITDTAMNSGSLVPTQDTASQITVNGQSQNSGVENNVAAGTIAELSNAPATLTSVINSTPFTGGADPEDTETFRARLLDYLQNPQTGSASDLKTWAENVPGVGTATIFPNSPANGSVTVRITGESGAVPSADLIALVQQTLEDLDLANITIIVTSFTAVPTDVSVDVTTTGTYTLADVTPSVQTAIITYINSLDVGETLRISGIIDAVFGLPGILDVTVTTPATNQTTNATDKRTPGTISVT